MDGQLLSDPIEYKSMVGAMQYLTMIRLDIAYVVNLFPGTWMHHILLTTLLCKIFVDTGWV